MTRLYKELFQAVNFDENGEIVQYRYNKEDVTLDKLAHFVSMRGELYDTGEVRLLVIGRATNDWGSLPCESAQAFAESANRIFNRTGFQWIANPEESFSKLHNKNDDLDARPYYLHSSPFWRVTYHIWRGLTDSSEEQFLKHIAWSNLYKIAPGKIPPNKRGNPTAKMCKQQFNACKAILDTEIRVYRPTHILIITGYDQWFAWSGGNFSALFKDNINIKDKRRFVEGTAEFQLDDGTLIPTVITCRPEGRNEDAFINVTLQAFHSGF